MLVVGGCLGEGLGELIQAFIGLGAAVASGNGARAGLSVEEKWCRAANSLQLLLKGGKAKLGFFRRLRAPIPRAGLNSGHPKKRALIHPATTNQGRP